MSQFAIKSKKVITPLGVKEAFVLIKDNVIADVVTAFESNDAYEVIDVGDKVVMAGVIDPHVHINEPGRTDWEGFETATKAAIAGGLTTLVDMPLNSSPVTTTVRAFEEKLLAAKNKLHTNVGFWGGVVPGNENEIEGLINNGVLGFKAFLTHSGIDDFPNVSEEDLKKVMPIIAKNKLPLLVHCELSADNGQCTTDDNGRSYNNYLASRPKEWEDKAIAMMIRLCEEYYCRVHIVHLSSANSIEQIRKAKKKGLRITVETAQHYLYFNAEDIADGQTQFKCAPPIREKANNDLLWEALKDGTIDFVASDHSPAPPEMKHLQTGNFMTAWGGIASLQFALPILWTEARKRNIEVDNMAKWLCEEPAKLIGKNNKGQLIKGYDADIIVWDAAKEFTVNEHMIHHRHKVTPYLNEKLVGFVEQTYLAGMKVYDNGNFIKLNAGKILSAENG